MNSTHFRVAVLMGGESLEHEVSLRSGAGAAAALRRMGHEVLPVTIGKDGGWSFGESAPVPLPQAVSRLAEERPDCVFVALHGGAGEDGRMQGLLELLGLPYTTSGSAASGLCMDKIRAKTVVEAAGIRVAPQAVVTLAEWRACPEAVTARIRDEIGVPCVIKAPNQGSSCGMAICRAGDTLADDIERVLAVEGRLMAEAFVPGTELTCAVLDVEPGARPRALPITEIRPKTSAYFDYEAKYTPGASEEITPAPIPEPLAETVRAAAVGAHEALGCRLWSRSDFILGPDGPVWLEVNTVPGLTETSLFPQAAAAAGISYDRLMDLFVRAAVELGKNS
ncbi:MAG: D-alanine--D-alanine ligase [Candidatus Hydrogenedentes bacterium]|nr:D-alanine--D-alanine ligase [Candidatus Hydrogenedentota bacterium]